MEPIDENFDIGLIEGQKFFYKQARTILKERPLACRVFHSALLEDFVEKGVCTQEYSLKR